jgi:hypothetical protein
MVRHQADGLTVDGRACGDDWLTFAELAAGLLHRDDSGHRLGGGTGRGAAGVLRRVMRASPGPSA